MGALIELDRIEYILFGLRLGRGLLRAVADFREFDNMYREEG